MRITAGRLVGTVASAVVLIGTVAVPGAGSRAGAAALGRSPLTTPPADWRGESNVVGAHDGYSLATGDVNCDGFQDLIAGNPSYVHGQIVGGAVFVYEGSASGLASTPAWTNGSTQGGASFGSSVTSTDVNGDGCDDLMVGAPNEYVGMQHEGEVFAYYGSPGGLPSSSSWHATGHQADGQFGFSVASLGSDLIVGATAAGTHGQGAVYLYEGRTPKGLKTAPRWTFHGPDAGALAGWSVAGIPGGYPEVAVGAPHWNGFAGEVFVLRASDGSPRWKVRATKQNRFLGNSVSGGDVNGDGWGDVLIGEPYFSHGQTSEGRVLLYEGSSNGIHGPAAWTHEGNQAGADYGTAVAFVDVNGDSISDVAIDAPDWNGQAPDDGKVFVYMGSDGGPPGTASWTAESDQTGSVFGNAIAAGWFGNPCCVRSLAIGASSFSHGQAEEGAAFVFDQVP